MTARPLPTPASRPSLASVTRRARLGIVAGTAACVLACVAGCGGSKTGGTGIHSPERQSDSEYDLAVDTYHKQDYRQALDHVLKAVELNDENAKAAKFAAELYVLFCDKGEDLSGPDCHIDLAEKYAKAAVAAESKFNDAKNTLASIYILEKKYKDAIEIYSQLVKDPTYETMYLAWGNLGWAQIQAGQLDEGIRSLKNSTTEPRFCVGFYRLGVAYEKKGDYQAALAAHTQALGNENCQKLQDGFAGRAKVELALGKAQDARADLEKCKEIAAESKAGKACSKELARIVAVGPSAQ
jgi:type IV pilus assembly protein PilF